jgi:hypothetical protein
MNRERAINSWQETWFFATAGAVHTNRLQALVKRLELHEGQQVIVSGARRFNVVACGRRFGKTRLGIDRAIETALDGYPVAWFSPTYKMLADAWRELKNIAAPLNPKINEAQHRLELADLGASQWGETGLIDMWSLDSPDRARGRKYKRAIIDEAAMVGGLGDAWQHVIRPMLSDLRGDAWFLSTPRGHNFFWELYCKGQDRLQQEWGAWRMPTSANPFIPKSEIEDARLMLPEMVFGQEYLAEFIEVGATAKASLLLINTQLLPKTWKAVDSLKEATGRISDLTAHTDTQLNQQIMPGFADLIRNSIKLENQLGIDVEELGDAIKLTSQQTGLSLQEIQKRIADPRFDTILDTLAGTASHLNGTTAEIEAASRRLPEIADALAKISKTTSRFSKAYWVARILSIVVPLVP